MTDRNILDKGKRVIQIETQAVNGLLEKID